MPAGSNAWDFTEACAAQVTEGTKKSRERRLSVTISACWREFFKSHKEENLDSMLSMAFLLKTSHMWSLRNEGGKGEKGHFLSHQC